MKMNEIMDWLNQVILLILGFSTLIGILDFVGILPEKVKKRFKLNRASDTIDVLKEMGVDIDRYKINNESLDFPRALGNENLQEIAIKSLDNLKIDKKISVGHLRPTKLQHYYDLIGGSTDNKTAEYFANILSSYWAENCTNQSIISAPEFDFIVTPKSGSPILGYEFAKLCGKPFVLHEDTPRFKDNENDMRKWFNCKNVPEEGQTALIVDDSITGGSMCAATIDHLKQYKYNVKTCYVVFEVCAKNGRARLADKNVHLVSIVQTHKN